MKLDSERYVIAGNVRVLDDVLWEWVYLQERTSRLWKWYDAPWWYGERAALGVLAGAVWRAGGTTLDEYPTEKKAKERGSNPPRGSRCDLYIRLPNAEFVLEAKHLWLPLRSRNLAARMKAKLQAAAADARRTASYGAPKLGVIFVTPYAPTQFAKAIDSLVAEAVEAIAALKPHGRAWAFPRRMRNLTPEDGKRVFPGTCIIVRRI